MGRPRLAWTDDLNVVGAVETELEPPEREVLAKLLNRERVEPDAFLDVSALRQVFTVLAVGNVAERIHHEEGLSEVAAYKAACREIGVPWRTVQSWRSRWAPDSE